MASFTPQEIEQFLQQFFDVVGARQYVGARYVPIFGRAGEDTVEWDDGAPYEPLTVVMHDGVSYVSRRYVPAGVEISDTAYWVQTYRFNAQVEQYRQEVLAFDGRIDAVEDALPVADFDDETVHAYVDRQDTTLRNDLTGSLVPFPEPPDSTYGTVGQVLATKGDGSTVWQNPVVPDAQSTAAAVSDWLDDHPEATTTVQDGSITTAKLANEAVTNGKLDPTGLIQYDFAMLCISDARNYLVQYNVTTKMITFPPGCFIYRNGKGYPTTQQTINVTDYLSSGACVLKVNDTNLIYAVSWQSALTDNVGDKIIGYIYNTNVFINGVDQSRIQVQKDGVYQINPTMTDRIAMFMANNNVVYDYATKVLSIPAGFGCIGHRLLSISAQNIDLSNSLAAEACYLYMTNDGAIYGIPFAATQMWSNVTNQADALLGLLYVGNLTINGFPPNRIVVKYAYGFKPAEPAIGTIGLSDNKIVVYDMTANTLYLPQCFYDSPVRGGTFPEQTVDVSIRSTHSGACLLWIDESAHVVATAWGNNVAPTANSIYIGYLYNKMFCIFGLTERNVVVKQMPSPVWCFGDSITAGTGASVPYHQVWNNMCMDHSFKNWGVGSTGYVVETSSSVNVGGGAEGQGPVTQQSGDNSVKKVMQSVSGSPACITIAAGTNDWGSSVPIADFRTAVADAIAYALTRCNRVLAISPIRRDIADNATNSIGLTLDDYATVIREEAATHGANFASGFDVFFNPHIAVNKSAFAPDGLHPNNLGHEIMARTWYQRLLESLGE